MTHATMLDLDSIFLASGGHASPEEGMCVMEATAYFAREPFSDHPMCVSPAIASFCRSWNDSLSDEDRNRLLKPYVTKVIGTRTTDADEQTRAWLATDWLVRVNAPAWLDLAGLKDDATALRNLPPLTSSEIALAVQDTINSARQRADAAGDAARAAARDAARDAASAAAWDAARAAARDAARDAVWDAAWAAAWAAARDAARDAARAASWDAAWAAAWAAARGCFRPVVEQLQASALSLLDAMIVVGRVESVVV